MAETNGGQNQLVSDPGFAPEDSTDGRKLGEWETRYPPDAQKFIRAEAAYLALLLTVVLVAMLLVWLGIPQTKLGLSDPKVRVFTRYALGGLSGVVGGILFAMKWLYHSVAKRLWNFDRRLWRLFTPIISGGLAFMTIAIVRGFGPLGPNLASTNEKITALAFLVGFFSDNALAKLAEVAQTLFGPTHRKLEHSTK